MKRQVAIVGPTPEFVRWSIRYDCPLRTDTDISSVDATEKRLRAIREAGLAIRAECVHQGIAVRRDEKGHWLGFRIDDVFGLWGGCDKVQSICQSCIANPMPPANKNELMKSSSAIAGCFGWLAMEGDHTEWHRAVDQYWPEGDEPSSIRTDPRWYSLWAERTLSSRSLERATELFCSIAEFGHPLIRKQGAEFHNVLHTCMTHRLNIDVELIPAGFSDGITWTIGRHCDQCKAPMGDSMTWCHACRKQGRGHPEIKKRVLGLRPWVPLSRVTGKANLQNFLNRANLVNPE